MRLSAKRFCENFTESAQAIMELKVELFEKEMAEALMTFEKYVVCLDKTPEQCREALGSLMAKAIKAYQNRGANLRHGIALDQYTTVMISQSEGDRPLCGIYFNLYTPYRKPAEKAKKA
jgi:hypothetical protein